MAAPTPKSSAERDHTKSWIYLFGLVFRRSIVRALRRRRDRSFALIAAGKVADGLALSERTLAKAEAIYGKDSVFTLDALFVVAWCRLQDGRDAEAEQLLLHMSEINARNELHDRTLQAAEIWYALGTLELVERRNPVVAISYLSRSLAIHEKLEKPNLPYLAKHHLSLSSAYLRSNDSAAAVSSARLALALIERREFGKSARRERSATLLSLGRALAATDDLAGAAAAIDESLRLAQMHGNAGSDPSLRFEAMASLAFRSGDDERAIGYALQAIEAYAAVYPTQRAYLLSILIKGWREQEPSIPIDILVSRANSIALRQYPQDTIRAAKSLRYIGILLHGYGEFSEAIPFHSAAFELMASQYATRAEMTPFAMSLAVSLRDEKRFDEAIALYRNAIAIHETNSQTGDPLYLVLHNKLAHALVEAKRADEAECVARHALAIAEGQPTTTPRELASHLSTLALALELKNDGDEALALRDRSLDLAKAVPE